MRGGFPIFGGGKVSRRFRRDGSSREKEGGPGSGTPVVLSVINSEIEAEEARKESIERRGLAVVSTSGTLITALFALSSLITVQDKYRPPSAALILTLCALALFVAAAVQGLTTNMVSVYQRIGVEDLRKTTEEDLRTITEAEAQGSIAQTNVRVLDDARDKNGNKARQLKLAIWFEVSAVLSLAGAVAVQILYQLVPALQQTSVWPWYGYFWLLVFLV
jgi:hypothetical protein